MARFCQRCFLRHLDTVSRCTKGAKNVVIDARQMWFRCKTPIFGHDYLGNAMVQIWDCEHNRETFMSQAEFLKKRAAGELDI